MVSLFLSISPFGTFFILLVSTRPEKGSPPLKSKRWFRIVLWLMIASMVISSLMYLLEAFIQPF
jgi:hypothetical protein